MKKTCLLAAMLLILCAMGVNALAQFDMSLFEEGSEIAYMFSELTPLGGEVYALNVTFSAEEMAFEHAYSSEKYYSMMIPQILLTLPGTKEEITFFRTTLINYMDQPLLGTHTVRVQIGEKTYEFDVASSVIAETIDETTRCETIPLILSADLMDMFDHAYEAVFAGETVFMTLEGKDGSVTFEMPQMTLMVNYVAYEAYRIASGLNEKEIERIVVDEDSPIRRPGLLFADPAAKKGEKLYIPQADTALTFPLRSGIFWKNMPEDEPALAAVNMTSEQVTRHLNDLAVDYAIYDFSDHMECWIWNLGDLGVDFYDLSLLERDMFLAGIAQGAEQAGAEILGKKVIYSSGEMAFQIELAYIPDSGTKNYAMEYIIPSGSKAIRMRILTDAEGGMTDEDRALCDALIRTVRTGRYARMEDMYLDQEKFRLEDKAFTAEFRLPPLWRNTQYEKDLNGASIAVFSPYGEWSVSLAYQYIDMYQNRLDSGEQMPERNAFFDNEESLQQIYEQFPMMLGMSEVVDCGFETISGVEYYYAEGVCAAAYNGNEPGLLSMAMLCDRETGVVHVFWLLAPTLEEWTAQAPAIRELLESVKYTR